MMTRVLMACALILICAAGEVLAQEEAAAPAPAEDAAAESAAQKESGESSTDQEADGGSATDGNQDTGDLDGYRPGVFARSGPGVPSGVREIYDRGAMYLAESQTDDGSWGRQSGVGGLCIMALLSTGEDPNFGRYAVNVRRGVRALIKKQNKSTGYIGDSMYDHGFAMLALSEAYGAVDDELLWAGEEDSKKKRTIGEALERCARDFCFAG